MYFIFKIFKKLYIQKCSSFVYRNSQENNDEPHNKEHNQQPDYNLAIISLPTKRKELLGEMTDSKIKSDKREKVAISF